MLTNMAMCVATHQESFPGFELDERLSEVGTVEVITLLFGTLTPVIPCRGGPDLSTYMPYDSDSRLKVAFSADWNAIGFRVSRVDLVLPPCSCSVWC
jgi:hypothetical protein